MLKIKPPYQDPTQISHSISTGNSAGKKRTHVFGIPLPGNWYAIKVASITTEKTRCPQDRVPKTNRKPSESVIPSII